MKLLACLLLLACAAAGSELTPQDEKLLGTLTRTVDTPSIVFHHEPDLPSQAVKTGVKLCEGYHRDLEKRLRMRYEGRIHVFLYRDTARLRALTGTKAWAFSTGTRSVHQPYDYDDAHEMTHIFALQIPKGDEHVPPGAFFVEGLATAMQREDTGIAIDDYAAVTLEASRMPRLVDLRRAWEKGAGAGVHPYHVAGSFVSFLIDTHGIEKVKRLYVNCLECQGILGVSFVRAEHDWWAWLGKRQVSEAHRTTVLARFGIGDQQRLPRALAKAKPASLFAGRTLKGWNLEHPGSWSAKGGLILGATTGPWHRIHTRRTFAGDVAVRVRLRLVAGDAVQIRLNRDATRANEAIFAVWKSFLLRAGPGGQAFAESPYRIVPGRWIDVVFVNRGGHGRVFVNGILILQVTGLATHEGSVGLSVERGRVEVSAVELLTLP